MNTLDRHLQHGPGLRAPGVSVLLDRGQQHPHQVHGVVEMLKRPADAPGVRPGGIGQLRVGLVLLVVSPSGQIGEVVLAPLPDLPGWDVSEVQRCRAAGVGQGIGVRQGRFCGKEPLLRAPGANRWIEVMKPFLDDALLTIGPDLVRDFRHRYTELGV